ncbi:MAG: methylmalonyl Co-A mutase-associated GTPase MeaB [Chloroflexia bacterium]|nr:methylmalonyl Co-A mutase-associated GTPase MeaB [Chloroflexia bacterium]
MTKKKDKDKSALNVMKGIEAPESVDANAAKRFLQKRKKEINVNQLVERILAGDKTALSLGITLIESVHPKHREPAEQLIEKCLPFAGNSIRVGITGVPGVGKSTFIEAMGMYLTKQGHNLAVLAIDPSSQQSGGSILGDKTRMELLSANPKAFIRPSPSGSTLGGVARKTRETVILCEAAGFDIIFIETVGVGQSETTVHSMVDFFLLLMLSGAGDELQGIKRGIMEMADTIIINKADGDNIKKAELAKREYENALHLFPPTESEWYPKVLLTSATKNTGIDNVWKTITDYTKHTKGNNYWNVNRSRQAKYRMHETIIDSLKSGFYQSEVLKDDIKEFEKLVQEGKTSPFFAAKQLLSKHFGK